MCKSIYCSKLYSSPVVVDEEPTPTTLHSTTAQEVEIPNKVVLLQEMVLHKTTIWNFSLLAP